MNKTNTFTYSKRKELPIILNDKIYYYEHSKIIQGVDNNDDLYKKNVILLKITPIKLLNDGIIIYEIRLHTIDDDIITIKIKCIIRGKGVP